LIFFYTVLGDDTCYRHVSLLSGGFCVFGVINALSAQFVGRNTPAIYSRIFSSSVET